MYGPAVLISTGVILPLLGVVFVCLRYWVRLRVQPSYIGVDDVLIVLGAFFTVAMGALQITNTVVGNLSPEIEATPQRTYRGEKLQYVILINEKLAYGFTKLSVLFFYRRIFSVNVLFRRLNNVMIVLVTAWTLAFFWKEVFVCGTDFSVQWKDHPLTPERCIKEGLSLVWFAATDVLADLIIVSMPFLVIFKLKMSVQQKWAISAVFFLGYLSTLAGALRLGFVSYSYSLGQMDWVPPPPPEPEPRVLVVINPIFWTTVEVCLAVIAGCLPPLGPLLMRLPTPKRIATTLRDKLSLSSHHHRSQTTLVDDGQLEMGKYDHHSRDVTSSHHSNDTVPTLLRTSFDRPSGDPLVAHSEREKVLARQF